MFSLSLIYRLYFSHENLQNLNFYDEKEHLTRDIQNLKRKNHFLQEDSQQAQEDIDLYKQLRTISRDDFKKDEEKVPKRNQSV